MKQRNLFQSLLLFLFLTIISIHNLIADISTISLAYIKILNPITATIGASIALSSIAHKSSTLCIDGYTKDNTIIDPMFELLPERFYYQQRLIALEALKQELVDIKNSLESIKSVYGNSFENFTYRFLQQLNMQTASHRNPLLLISADKEVCLSNKQKENLRIMRECKLASLEQEIISLQVALACHINELITHVYNAGEEYQAAQQEIKPITDLWNNNCYRMTDAIALQSYKAHLLEEHLLNNLDRKINELRIVAHYYSNCMNTRCIEQSTTILDFIEKMNSIIAQYDQALAQERARVARNIGIAEHYFAQRGISIIYIKNETRNHFEKARNKRDAQAVANAKNKLESIVVAGCPRNNNDNDKNSFTNKKLTKEELEKIAKDMGFEKTNYRSNGQPVYKKGNRYISPDFDSHNGGIWKMADSVKNLGRKATRMGTYDIALKWIGK